MVFASREDEAIGTAILDLRPILLIIVLGFNPNTTKSVLNIFIKVFLHC